MADTVFVVVVDNAAVYEPDMWAFEDAGQADEFAGVRGGCQDIHMLTVLDEQQAKQLITAEVKDRRGEEQCRAAGL